MAETNDSSGTPWSTMSTNKEERNGEKGDKRRAAAREARNLKEQRRAQKICSAINRLRGLLDEAEFPTKSGSKLHTLIGCETYIKQLQFRIEQLRNSCSNFMDECDTALIQQCDIHRKNNYHNFSSNIRDCNNKKIPPSSYSSTRTSVFGSFDSLNSASHASSYGHISGLSLDKPVSEDDNKSENYESSISSCDDKGVVKGSLGKINNKNYNKNDYLSTAEVECFKTSQVINSVREFENLCKNLDVNLERIDFRTWFEFNRIPMVVASLTGKIIESNKAFSQLVNSTKEELKLFSLNSLLSPTIQHFNISEAFSGCKCSGASLTLPAFQKDLNLKLSPLIGQNGQILCIQVAAMTKNSLYMNP
jgi:PAS domain-containing protein